MIGAGVRRVDRRAMGTTLSVVGPPDAFDAGAHAVAATFRREERRFSRFRVDSELSRVNERAGEWTTVSDAFGSLLGFSLDQASATGGIFDPTVLEAIEAAGYDRDFDEVLRTARGLVHPPSPCGRWREIEMRDRAVLLPRGVGLDVGGVAKGWTVDLAVTAALDVGMPWVLVSAGGDLRIAGDAPRLAIDVEDPCEPAAPLMTLLIDRGALATSGTAKRSWAPGMHHVIDPRTGAPAQSDAVQVTTWAPTCAQAEISATASLIRGTRAVADVPALIVGADGTVHVSFAAGDPHEAAA